MLPSPEQIEAVLSDYPKEKPMRKVGRLIPCYRRWTAVLFAALLWLFALASHAGEELPGRNGAFREAKRDLGIPMDQRAFKVDNKVPLTDRNRNPILDENKQRILTREYHFRRADGSHVVIQEHSRGHAFGEADGRGDQGPHFNVRPIEDTRHGTVKGTKEHYLFQFTEREAVSAKLQAFHEPSPMAPARVGGVALEGAGEALRGLGKIDGVAVDPNGQLVLLAATGSKIDLPPLNLDDVVTVFRSVYLHGKAPSVSIDPDPHATHPERSPMFVRHGKGTEGTYVGWVLFEADRRIKVYGQGQDNVTGAKVTTSVPGYRSDLECWFDGKNGAYEPNSWTRFWFAPSRVKRTFAPGQSLSLLDVTLEVKTEHDILRNGVLEPAKNARIDRCHKESAAWLTEHYDDLELADIVPLPSGHGRPYDQVYIFAELRRIALIAAVAESLRDQGILMPEWMRDYAVPVFPVPTQTPPIFVEATGTKDGSVYRLGNWGGVRLDADAAVVTTVRAGPTDRRRLSGIGAALHGSFGPLVAATGSAGTFGQSGAGWPAARETSKGKYTASWLPGDDSTALGAVQVDEVDLRAPLGTASLEHARHFHSFHRGSGELGNAWSMDLPRISRERGAALAGDPHRAPTFLYRLTSPLGTHRMHFVRTTWVPTLGRQLLVPQQAGSYLALGMNRAGEYLLYFVDGRRWRFSPEGFLLTQEAPGMTVHYRWDASHRLVAIEGEDGAQKKAAITFSYDVSGRITTAASAGARAQYTYDSTGALSKVIRGDGPHEYRYRNGLLAEVLTNGRSMRTYEYGPGGRVRQENNFQQGTKDRITYAISSSPQDTRIRMDHADGRNEERVFDSSMRPWHWKSVDGSTADWRYGKDGKTEIRFHEPKQGQWLIQRSADGNRSVWRSPAGRVYQVLVDSSGEETELGGG